MINTEEIILQIPLTNNLREDFYATARISVCEFDGHINILKPESESYARSKSSNLRVGIPSRLAASRSIIRITGIGCGKEFGDFIPNNDNRIKSKAWINKLQSAKTIKGELSNTFYGISISILDPYYLKYYDREVYHDSHLRTPVFASKEEVKSYVSSLRNRKVYVWYTTKGRAEYRWYKDHEEMEKRRSNPRNAAKKTAKRKAPPAKTLISECHRLWEHYCERPGKTRLKAVLKHCETMAESSAKSVKEERARCMRAARREMKKLGMK